jgi:hypothetical protein
MIIAENVTIVVSMYSMCFDHSWHNEAIKNNFQNTGHL